MSFASVGVFLVGIGAVVHFTVRDTVAIYDDITTNNFPTVAILNDMRLREKEGLISVAELYAADTTSEQAEKATKFIAEAFQKNEELAKQYSEAPFSEGEEPVWKDFNENSNHPIFKMMKEMARLSGTGKKADQKMRDAMFEHEFAEMRNAYNTYFEKLVAFQANEVRDNSAIAAKKSKLLLLILAGLVFSGVVFALTLGLLMANSLSKVLSRMSQMLAVGSSEVSATVSQLSSSSQGLSSSATEQAASLEETASALVEISSMLNRSSENAQESAIASEDARKNAEKGQLVVTRMVDAMTAIHAGNEGILAQVTLSNKKMTDIVTIIHQIDSKTKVINEIVFQTKLLSFNASVEAARAGDQGKGFSVVAEEVGSLARMSGAAASEISQLLSDSIKMVEDNVKETKMLVESSVQKARGSVDEGTGVAQECRQVLQLILTQTQTMSTMVSSIASSTQEQANGVKEITKAMSLLDQVTQSNSASANECATAAAELAPQAVTLKDTADSLRIIVEGGRKSVTAPRLVAVTVELADANEKHIETSKAA